MEAFSLLKYWRAGGGVSGGAAAATDFTTNATKTIVTAAAVSPYSSDGEDGPYFDLEFALPDHESDADDQTSAESQENDVVKTEDESESEEMSAVEDEDEAELKFSLSSNGSADRNAAVSPSDDLFFKGDLVSVEPTSILLNAAEDTSKFPVFFVKSATKFRVLLLKLKKSKSVNGGENPETLEKSGKVVDEASSTHPSPKILEKESRGKFFVKFKEEDEEEEAPLVKLFTRDSSSKQTAQDSDTNSDERKLSKEMMNKYLKMVKPFYIRVSKRYVKFPGHSAGASKGCATAPPPTNAKTSHSHHKQGNNLQAGLKVVRKHLGKSRSASAAAAPPPVVSDRRDDSLLQVQDGIQGAILHCKKSFNASRDVEASSILSRSVSEPKFSRATSSTSKGN